MTASTSATAYQRAFKALKTKYAEEYRGLYRYFVGQHSPNPYTQATRALRDDRHREEFDRLRESFKAELDGEVDAAIESIKRDAAALQIAVQQAEPEEWHDPTHGRIDRDIQTRVQDMDPVSVGQRVAMENTLQDKRDRERIQKEYSATREQLIAESEARVAERSSIPLEHYSMALDEIYLLRAMLADEADILNEHLEFKTFPLSRRKVAEQQVARMRGLAGGDLERQCREGFKAKDALRRAGIDECLTRSQWEEQRGLSGASD